MSWQQLELPLVQEVELITAKALNGNVYRLQIDQRDRKRLCAGCAFTTDSCMNEMTDDSCATALDGYGVWKLISQA